MFARCIPASATALLAIALLAPQSMAAEYDHHAGSECQSRNENSGHSGGVYDSGGSIHTKPRGYIICPVPEAFLKEAARRKGSGYLKVSLNLRVRSIPYNLRHGYIKPGAVTCSLNTRTHTGSTVLRSVSTGTYKFARYNQRVNLNTPIFQTYLYRTFWAVCYFPNGGDLLSYRIAAY